LKLDSYITLGRSGLRVSPLALGAMTFGNGEGANADEATSRKLFDMYVDKGGNFVDTADGYTGGVSESHVGKFIADTKSRDRIVLATKFTFAMEQGNPNAGGNGRKNILRAVEASLKRLGTDYIDLYWLHAWDMLTPVEEVLSTIDALVQAGKVRHFGLSDVPAWYGARAQTIAELRGTERIAAFQLEYSLLQRDIEREHIPLAQELGIALCPWSPLGSGFLTGKYRGAAPRSTASTPTATAPSSRCWSRWRRSWAARRLRSRSTGSWAAPASPRPSSARPSRISWRRTWPPWISKSRRNCASAWTRRARPNRATRTASSSRSCRG
jgi:aryl-alcohol dehydrogenase-like predicted oxidoreductase